MQHVALTVGIVAQRVLGPDAGGCLLQADPANTGTVYIGGAYVTADTTATGGIALPAGTAIPVDIDGDDPVWAIASAPGQILRVVQSESPDTTFLGL